MPTVPAEPVPVEAWVIWEDGVEELVRGHAVAVDAACRQGSVGCPSIPAPNLGLGRSCGAFIGRSHLGIDFTMLGRSLELLEAKRGSPPNPNEAKIANGSG